ncbi:MAG: hypothetical protein BZ151_07190 [Desulfobacca sp. 4484_104]|nr:MAG: hypothetical protein BZ151_07190 [Desulfobacca sp. 4484_104]RLA88184.1 MAG: hypothetical protein DRG58_08720 [Deltaproteobacteria bacterium]
MARRDKVLAAVAAAIQAYIQDEEAILRAQAAAPVAAPAQVPATLHNLWGLAGRQAAMQWRVMLQRRSLR